MFCNSYLELAICDFQIAGFCSSGGLNDLDNSDIDDMSRLENGIKGFISNLWMTNLKATTVHEEEEE